MQRRNLITEAADAFPLSERHWLLGKRKRQNPYLLAQIGVLRNES